MSISVRKEMRANGKEYYKLYEVKRVNGNVKTKYVGYLWKSPRSKVEITGEEILQYVFRLMKKDLKDGEIKDILNKIGINYDIEPITKIIIENDRKLNKIYIRLK
jgi:Na+/phosphate symporter